MRQLIENVQKFGLRICSKQWDLGYDELWSNFSVPIAFSRINLQLHHKLCTIFKIVHNLISFPSSVFPSRCWSNVYFQPFAHTNCFLHSFVPSTISSWNSLPECIHLNFVNRVHLCVSTCYCCTPCSYA